MSPVTHVARRTLSVDWSLAGEGAHVVQFYSTDDDLVGLLSRYVGTALATGDSAVVIAQRRHRGALQRRLKARGLDVGVARHQGRYLAMDSDAMARTMCRAGIVDRDLLLRTIRRVVRRAAGAAEHPSRRVFAFGDMVARLWAAGSLDAAIRAEEIWNQVAESHLFTLCCAYPMKGFTGEAHAAPFMRICGQHSHVFPAERRAALPARAVAAAE